MSPWGSDVKGIGRAVFRAGYRGWGPPRVVCVVKTLLRCFVWVVVTETPCVVLTLERAQIDVCARYIFDLGGRAVVDSEE